MDSELRKIAQVTGNPRTSSIYWIGNSPPYYHMGGKVRQLNLPAYSDSELLNLLQQIIPEQLQSKLEKKQEGNVCYLYENLVRVKALILYEQQKLHFGMRLHFLRLPTIEETELPLTLGQACGHEEKLTAITESAETEKSTILEALADPDL